MGDTGILGLVSLPYGAHCNMFPGQNIPGDLAVNSHGPGLWNCILGQPLQHLRVPTRLDERSREPTSLIPG